MKRWAVLASFWLLIFSYGSSWFAIAPLLKDLEEIYNIGGAQSHLLLSIIGLFVIFFAWPAGGLVDKKGPRRSAIIGALFMVLGFGGRAIFNESYVHLLLCTSIAGIGLAWILVALAPQMIQWFEKKAPLAIGLTSSGLFIGFGTASFLSPYIKEIYGLTSVYSFFAILCLISFIVYLILGKDKGKIGREKTSFLEGMKSIFTSKNAVIYPLVGFFIVGATLSASALLPKWLAKYGLQEIEGGKVISLMLFGCAVGAFFFPHIATKYGIKRITVLVSLFSIIFWLPFFYKLSVITYLFVAFLFGIFLQAGWPIALHCQETEEGVNEENEGIAASLYISISNIGGAILPVIIGKLIDISPKNAYITIAIFLLILLLLWSIIKK